MLGMFLSLANKMVINDVLAQNCVIPIFNALEIAQSYSNPSIWELVKTENTRYLMVFLSITIRVDFQSKIKIYREM